MLGMYFAHVSPDPKVPGRMLIKQGSVKAAVGVGRWMLSFVGKNYNFSNVFSAENLEGFAFFDTPQERAAFIADLLASNALPDPGAGVTEAAPEPASVQ